MEKEKTLRNSPPVSSRFILMVFVSLILILLATYFLIGLLKTGQVDHILMDDYVSADVIYEDGTIRHSDSNYFPAASKNDKIIIHIPLDKKLYKKNQAVCFEFYNSVISVDHEGELLYTYGRLEAENNHHIGHVIASIPVPENAWGNSLTITLIPQESELYTNIKKIYLLDAVASRNYPLIGNQIDYFFFLPLLIVSFLAIIVFLVSYLVGYKKALQGLYLSLFLCTVSCWYMGYQGIFYLISDNISLSANIEYQALYFFMIPFLAYIRKERNNFLTRKVLPILEIIFIISFTGINILSLLNTGIDHSDFINYERLLILISLVTSVISLLIHSKNNETASGKVLNYGFILIILFGIIETIRVTMVSLFDTNSNPFIHVFLGMNFSRIMILLFLISLVLSFVLRALNTIRLETQRQQLSKLAYIDLLTGIPNRQDADRNFNSLSIEKIKDCAVLFFDANDLKKANDTYGHEAGDYLLKSIASALSKAMEGIPGFYGRFGGDEFIACLYNSKDEPVIHERFFSYIDEINKHKTMPFDVSVAYGFSTITKEETKDQTQLSPLIALLIRKADEAMYQNKIQMKKQRTTFDKEMIGDVR